MKYYFKVIRNEDKYQFVLLPSNNHGQPMGMSPFYDSYEDCQEAFYQFRNLVISSSEECSRINKIRSKYYQYEFIDSDGNVLFSKSYSCNANAESSRESVIKHINYPLV